jgi:hypothetical protein
MTPIKQRTVIIGLIIIGILLAGFFGLRAFIAFSRFRGHPPPPLPAAEAQQVETDVELIRDWMTIPYIARTYQVSPKYLFDALGIHPRGNEEKSLAQLNEEYSPQAPGIVVEVIKAAIRAKQPAPPTVIPDTPVSPVSP